MMKFSLIDDGYLFLNGDDAVALGVYEQGVFCLAHGDKTSTFSNAMEAFSHLRSIYEPSVASPKTMELFLTPSRPIDNMSKYRDNVILKDMPSEVFHANLPR